MPIEGQFTLPIGFELTAVFLFAMTGALLAIESRYDIIGVFVLALLSAVGSGLVRDGFFLQQGPPLVLKDERYLLVVVLAVALCLIFGTHWNRIRLVFLLADALGLGIYAVVGAQRSLEFGLGPLAAAFVGLASAVGGGMLRDVLTAKETLLFKPGEFYILAAAVGMAVFLGLGYWADLPAPRAAIWSITTTFLIRLAALSFNWKTTAARPLLGHRSTRAESRSPEE
jgi:uncharacterized membrane protein YeiH